MQQESYRLIPLPKQGGGIWGHAKVDPEDFERLREYRWFRIGGRSGRYYAGRKNDLGHNVSMHREIAGIMRGDKLVVDHLNGDPLDNRRANLCVMPQARNIRLAFSPERRPALLRHQITKLEEALDLAKEALARLGDGA